jgi:hypothetical protein
MWRFSLAGLLTIGGLILFSVGFLGDPAMTARVAAFLSAEAHQATADGTIPAEKTETSQGAAVGRAAMALAAASTQPSGSIVVVPVNREPATYAPAWVPDSTPVPGFEAPKERDRKL